MSQYNSAAEGDLHSFHTPWTPMTRSRAEATGGSMQLPGGGETLNRCPGNGDSWHYARAAGKLGHHLHSQGHQSVKAAQQPGLTKGVPGEPQLSQGATASLHGWGLTPNTGGQWEMFPALSSKLQGYCQGRGHFTRLLRSALGNS